MKRIILLTLLGVLVTLPMTAQQYSNQLKDLLVDLPGWEGQVPEGADISFNQITTVTATRDYVRGDATLKAAVMVTDATSIGQVPRATFENEEAFLRTEQINGFDSYISFNKKDKSGAVFVILGTSPRSVVFTLTFEGIGWEEARKLVERYDLAAMLKVARNIQ